MLKLFNTTTTCGLNNIWHVGSLNVIDKKKNSYEGNGLSMSQHPEAWRMIAQLGNAPVWSCDKPTNMFLDYHNLTAKDKNELLQWGIRQEWAQPVKRWRVNWLDTETEQLQYMQFDTENIARSNYDLMSDDDTATLAYVETYGLTKKAFTRLGFNLDDTFVHDILATFCVEDTTNFDGVWWNDTLDPLAYSAPRGVINLKQLHTWTMLPCEKNYAYASQIMSM